jgi:cytochrome b6-f complex iron-sulfur subunit
MNQEEKIDRNEFLKKIGFSGAALFTLYTLDSCTNDSTVTPSGTVITIDLTASANAALKTSGGYVINNGVVIANNNGTYIAATLTCSHEGETKVTFRSGEWYCTAHGARFSTTGGGLNTEGKKGLTVYKTNLTGTTITITT